jgi:hypothetical protein
MKKLFLVLLLLCLSSPVLAIKGNNRIISSNTPANGQILSWDAVNGIPEWVDTTATAVTNNTTTPVSINAAFYTPTATITYGTLQTLIVNLIAYVNSMNVGTSPTLGYRGGIFLKQNKDATGHGLTIEANGSAETIRIRITDGGIAYLTRGSTQVMAFTTTGVTCNLPLDVTTTLTATYAAVTSASITNATIPDLKVTNINGASYPPAGGSATGTTITLSATMTSGNFEGVVIPVLVSGNCAFGTAVYQTQWGWVDKVDNRVTANFPVLGIVVTTTGNGTGYVLTSGKVFLASETFNLGTIYYIDTDGTYTSTAPVAPNWCSIVIPVANSASSTATTTNVIYISPREFSRPTS